MSVAEGLRARGWQQEAALRMLQNNLHPDVAEKPEELIVYGGTGKAARNRECYDAIVRELERLADDETLLVQSGKPVGVFETHELAPRVLIANSNLVPKWATWKRRSPVSTTRAAPGAPCRSGCSATQPRYCPSSCAAASRSTPSPTRRARTTRSSATSRSA